MARLDLKLRSSGAVWALSTRRGVVLMKRPLSTCDAAADGDRSAKSIVKHVWMKSIVGHMLYSTPDRSMKRLLGTCDMPAMMSYALHTACPMRISHAYGRCHMLTIRSHDAMVSLTWRPTSHDMAPRATLHHARPTDALHRINHHESPCYAYDIMQDASQDTAPSPARLTRVIAPPSSRPRRRCGVL